MPNMVYASGEIENFREDGTQEQKEYLVLGTINRTRVNYYNLDGSLDSYEVIRNRKKKTITFTYDLSGKLIDKSEVRHIFEKYR